MLWAMWGFVFWAVFQGFATPKILGNFSAFEQTVLALLADATIAVAFGFCAVVSAIKARPAAQEGRDGDE